MASSTVRLNNAAASSIGKRFRETLKRFCFHMFHFLQLISKGYKRQKSFITFRTTKTGILDVFASYKRAKLVVLVVLQTAKRQNQSFWHFCKLQKSKNRCFGRFTNCKRIKTVVLAFLQITKVGKLLV